MRHSVHERCSNCLRKRMMSNDRNMQKTRRDVKALEQETILRVIFVVQLDVQLDRDQVEVGKTCQHAMRPIRRTLA